MIVVINIIYQPIQDQPTISLIKGNTYIFDQSDSSNDGHPLQFSTTSNGTHGGGTAYTTGVTTVGTAGQAGAYVQIVTSDSTPVNALLLLYKS